MADATAGNRHRLVDLPGHQHGIDIELTEIVDNYADPGAWAAKHVVEQRRFASAEIAGQANDGDPRRQGT
jgi:hypothetical protein